MQVQEAVEQSLSLGICKVLEMKGEGKGGEREGV